MFFLIFLAYVRFFHYLWTAAIQSVEQIESLIITVRGKQVILDRDLARLYGVETKRLNEQVRRNIERFPEDFMFQLSKEEAEFSRSHFVTLNSKHIQTWGGIFAPQDYIQSGNFAPWELLNLIFPHLR